MFSQTSGSQKYEAEQRVARVTARGQRDLRSHVSPHDEANTTNASLGTFDLFLLMMMCSGGVLLHVFSLKSLPERLISPESCSWSSRKQETIHCKPRDVCL